MPPLGSSPRAGRQNTHLHRYGSFTGYASRNESSFGCVFWRTIVCMAQHRRTFPITCGRHQRSSLVAVFALLTPRHYRCRRLVGLPLATAPFRWLQRVHGSQPLETRVCASLLTFRRETKLHLLVSHITDLIGAVYSNRQQASALNSATVLAYIYFVNLLPQLCDGSTIIWTSVVAALT